MKNYISTIPELEVLFSNRHNLNDFHYFTNDESVYEHFCKLVADSIGVTEDLRDASNASREELDILNRQFGLSLEAAYLNGPECECGRALNGYDFIVNAVFRHGASFIRNQKPLYGARFVLPLKRAMNFIVCTSCGELSPLAATHTYSDKGSETTYGPCSKEIKTTMGGSTSGPSGPRGPDPLPPTH